MDLTRAVSQRGKTLLIYKNQTFKYFRNLKSGEQCWRCSNFRCRSKLYTFEEGSLFSRLEGEHTHDAIVEKVLNRRCLNNIVKRKATENMDERPSKLIKLEIENDPSILNSLGRNDVRLIQNTISRERIKHFPKLPKNATEVQLALNEIETKTVKNEDFLLANNIEKGIVMFSCETNLQFLSEKETLLMDGTFEYASKHFLQMFTIHGYSDGTYVPLVFLLLKDKKKQTYIDALRILKVECRKRCLRLNPSKIVIDFEISIHESVAAEFPEVNVVGCRFHLAQSW